jgi:hypothetical protein
VDGDATVRPRIRGTAAGRRTAAVLVSFVVAAVAGVLLATALGSQRYVLLMPLHTWLARAVVVTFSPLLLGVAWFLTTRGRWTAIVCVVTTLLVQAAGVGLGALWATFSGFAGESSVQSSEVFAVSPQGRYELVWGLHDYPISTGRYETVRIRSRVGLVSRESVEDLVRCEDSKVGRRWVTTASSLVAAGDVSFVDETTIRIASGGTREVVRFDAATLRFDHTVILRYCPSANLTAPP